MKKSPTTLCNTLCALFLCSLTLLAWRVPPANAYIYAMCPSDTIAVFENTARGYAEPLRIIKGLNTGLAGTSGITVYENELFVTSQGDPGISVFNTTDSGNVVAKRLIRGDKTTLGGTSKIQIYQNEMYVTNNFTYPSTFNITDNGNVAPKRSLSTFWYSKAMAISGDEIFLARTYNADTVSVYDRTDFTKTTPKRTLTGSNTGFKNVSTLCAYNNELFVADQRSSSIRVFNLTDSGDVAPKRIIQGAKTGLSGSSYIFITAGEIYASCGGAVKIFNTTDSGNVAPKGILYGAKYLGGVGGIFMDSSAINGDVDGDGSVTMNDWKMARALIGKKTGNAGYVAVADINSDGVIWWNDLTLILRAMQNK